MKEIMKRELTNLEAKIAYYENEIKNDMNYVKSMHEKNNIDGVIKHSQYIKETQEKLLIIREILKEFKVLAVEEKELFITIQELEDKITKIVY